MNLLRKAFQYAKKNHDATGKLYNGQSFIWHPVLVYHILCQVAKGDENLLVAGLCHDLIEDADITFQDLVNEFNADVASLVREVTEDENKNFPNLKTVRGLILKTADQLANTSNLNELPPDRKEKLFRKYAYGFIHRGDILKRA